MNKYENVKDRSDSDFRRLTGPTIELITVVSDNTPGEDWVSANASGEIEVRERWFWTGIGEPTRQGWNVKKNDWDEKVPWGAPNVAKSRRPEPHRVGAFDPPEKQAEEIVNILLSVLQDRIKKIEEEAKESEETPYRKLLNNVKEIQKTIVQETVVI
jgi:putative ATP-dependent endonuclease of OLD family